MFLLEFLHLAGWQSKDSNRRKKAVDKVTDQRELFRIAKKGCSEAAWRLQDEKFILYIAVNENKSILVRIISMLKLSNEHQEEFERIAKNEKEFIIREEAVGKLTNQNYSPT